MKKIIIFFVIAGIILPFGAGFAQQEPISPPENLGEIKGLGQKSGAAIKEKLLGNLEKIWEEEVLPVWQKMYDWFLRNIWSKIENWFKNTFQPLLKGEVEKRKPIIEEELQKEKQELKEEAPMVGRSLWEKFKELISR